MEEMFKINYIHAYDLSMESTGFCIFDENMNPILIDSIPTKKSQSHGKRLKVIATKMAELKTNYPTKTIVIERGFSRFNMATQVIYRVHGVCNLIFHDTEQIYYPPKTVKEAILGGNATKKQVQEEIKKRYPNVVFKNEDESDAFAVGLTYFIKMGMLEWVKEVVVKEKKIRVKKDSKEKVVGKEKDVKEKAKK